MKLRWRKITVGDRTYRYRLGRQNAVITEDMERENNKLTPSFAEITGMTNAEVERAQRKGYFSITPKQIADYIKNQLRSSIG